MITTKKREETRLEGIVRDLERLADAEEKQNEDLGRWIDFNVLNNRNGQRAGARKVLSIYKETK